MVSRAAGRSGARRHRSRRRRLRGTAFYGDLFRHDPEAHADPTDDELREVAREAGLLDVVQAVAPEGGLEAIAEAMGKEALRRLVDQAGRYFADPQTLHPWWASGSRLLSVLTPRCMIAHSLGSIAAYEALCVHRSGTSRRS